jgi:hypothetical protein
MTRRLFYRWLHIGALTGLVTVGVALAVSLILLTTAAYGPGISPLDRIILMRAFADLSAWLCGAVLIAIAAWAFTHSLTAAFPPQRGRDA